MKDSAINKIRNFGKVGNIITNIAKVIIIIGMVLLIGCGIVFAVMPKDFIKVDIASKATVTIDGEKLGIDAIKNLNVDQINAELKEELEADMEE